MAFQVAEGYVDVKAKVDKKSFKDASTEIRSSLAGMDKLSPALTAMVPALGGVASLGPAVGAALGAVGLAGLSAAAGAGAFLGVAKNLPATKAGTEALSKTWQNFSKSLSGVVSPVVTKGFDILRTAVPALRPLVVATAGAFSDLEKSIGSAVGGSQFKTFMASLGTLAGGSIRAIGAVLGGIATAFMHIATDLAPAVPLIDKAGTAFGQWLGHVTGTKQFADALQGMIDKIPAAFKFLGDLAKIGGAAFGGVLAVAEPLFNKVIVPLVSFLADHTKAVANFAAAALLVAGAFKAMRIIAALTSPIGLIVLAIAGLATGFEYAWKNSETFRDVVKRVFGDVQAFAGKAIDWVQKNLVPIFSGVIGAIKKDALPVLSGIVGRIGDVFGGIKKSDAAGILNTLKGAIGGLGTIVKTVFGALADYFGKVGPAAFTLYRDLAGALIPALVSIGKTVGPLVVTVFESLANSFTKYVVPAIVAVYGWLDQHLVPIFRSVVNIIANDVVPIIATLVTWFVTKLVPVVLQIAEAIGKKLQPVFNAIAGVVQRDVLPAVQNLLVHFKQWQPTIQAVITVLVKIIGKVLEFAAAILGKVLPPLIKLVGFLIKDVFDSFVQVIGVIVSIVKHLLTFGSTLSDMWSGAKKIFSSVVNWFEGIPGTIGKAIGNLGSLLYDKGKALLQGLWNGTKAVWNSVTGWIGGLGSSAFRAIGNLGSTLYSKGKALIGGFWTAEKDGWVSIAHWFEGLPGKIVSALGNVGSLLYGKGKALIGGLKDGASDALTDVENAFINPIDWIGHHVINPFLGTLHHYLKDIGFPNWSVPDPLIKKREKGGPLGAGDLSWVGERGPELIRVGAGGAQVYSHGDSMRMTGGQGPGNGMPGYFLGGVIGKIKDAADWTYHGARNIAGTVVGQTIRTAEKAANAAVGKVPGAQLFRTMADRIMSHVADGAEDWIKGKGHKNPPKTTGVGDMSAHSASAGAAQSYARSILSQFGWGPGEMGALTALWNGESGWNNLAANPKSSAFGIAQFLDSTWGSFKYPKTTNYQHQVYDGEQYIYRGYHTPTNALGAWMSRSPHWYDTGGDLPPGLTLAYNGTGRTEKVRTSGQEAALQAQLAGRGSSGVSAAEITAALIAGLQGTQLSLTKSGARLMAEFVINSNARQARYV